MVDALPPIYASPEIRIPCNDDKKFNIVEQLKAQFPDAIMIDGVRVTTNDGWWLVRASNTQAALSARAEATSADCLVRLMHAMHAVLTQHGVKI